MKWRIRETGEIVSDAVLRSRHRHVSNFAPIRIADAVPLTAEEKAARLDAARAAALRHLADGLTRLENRIDGPRPPGERVSYAAKESSARAWLAGTAQAHDLASLHAEAGLTGETIDDLAARIVQSAGAFRPAIGALSGLRRQVAEAIALATTAAEVDAALADGLREARGMLDAWAEQAEP